jgi:hypothetical protein
VKQRSSPDATVRIGALVAVTLLHLPFIVAKRSRERPPTHDVSLLVRFIAATPHEIEPQHRLDERELPQKTTTPKQSPRQRASDVSSSSEPATPEGSHIDWYSESANASRAAIDSIMREESYRSLGPREKRFQIVEPKPPPPLFEEPKHRSGDIAPNPMGYDSVWHNHRCFTQLEQPIIPHLPAAPGDTSSVNPVKCFWPLGTPEPRGDLFEHLKRKRDKAPLPGETASR